MRSCTNVVLLVGVAVSSQGVVAVWKMGGTVLVSAKLAPEMVARRRQVAQQFVDKLRKV